MIYVTNTTISSCKQEKLIVIHLTKTYYTFFLSHFYVFVGIFAKFGKKKCKRVANLRHLSCAGSFSACSCGAYGLDCKAANMASNSKLSEAKSKKNDEFYTQYADIEKEVNAYLEYDPDVFRGKTILLPCDDPESSNFTIFFAQNFERLGLKKLISTSYAVDSKDIEGEYIPSEFEQNSPLFDWASTRVKGKIFVLEKDITGDGKINHSDLEWNYLEGDGDFRSEEVCKLRDEADIIITNPPFSLFREFLAWLMAVDKKFLLIANKTCINYKEVFPLIMENRMWSGRTEWSGGMWFVSQQEGATDKVVNGLPMKNVGSVWFTNIEHGRRHQPIELMTMADNLKFSRHRDIRESGSYKKYENYEAINVPYTDAIPSDYDGVMGVPLTFLEKYCPEQFEIVGMASGNSRACGFFYDVPYTPHPADRGGVGVIDGVRQYARILIRKVQR